MSEQNNQNNQQNKTFTQSELDAIIQSRVAEEKKKYADYDSLKEKAGKYDEQQEANKTELQKANDKVTDLQKQLDAMKQAKNVDDIRAKVSKDTGVPANLLSGNDEETCKTQADAILKFAKPKSYPGTKRNNGTNNNAGSGDADAEAWKDFANSIFGREE